MQPLNPGLPASANIARSSDNVQILLEMKAHGADLLAMTSLKFIVLILKYKLRSGMQRSTDEQFYSLPK